MNEASASSEHKQTLRYQHNQTIHDLITTYEPQTVEDLAMFARVVTSEIQEHLSRFMQGSARRQANSKTPQATKQYDEIIASYLNDLINQTRQYYQIVLNVRSMAAARLIDWSDTMKLEQRLREAGPPIELPKPYK